MAFKILSFDELELLTENQRKSYEKELAIYHERVKFVEQMERLEHAVITPYEAKLEAISAICKIPEKEFAEPEYEVAKSAPFSKPELRVTAMSLGGPVKAVVPCHEKIMNAPAGYLKHMERDIPVLPVIFKAAAPSGSFVKAEQQRPVLPVSMKTSIPAHTFPKSERAEIRVNHPERMIPVMEAPAFTAPEYDRPVLPKMEVKVPEVSLPETPERAAPALPQMAVSVQTDVLWKQAVETEAELPEIFHLHVAEVSFSRPDIRKTELPDVQRTGIPSGTFTAPEHTVSDLPVAHIPEAGAGGFISPELRKPVIGPVMKPDVVTDDVFVAPELRKPVIQPVLKPAKKPEVLFTAPELRKPEILSVPRPEIIPEPYGGGLSFGNIPEVEYPSIDVLSLEPFEKIVSKACDIPVIHDVNVPGDCEGDLNNIQLLLRKEYETFREGSV